MEGISQEDGILNVDLNKEILSSVKNSWRFTKIADDENRLCQTVGDKHVEEKKN